MFAIGATLQVGGVATCVRFSPDGIWLAVAAVDGSVSICRATTGLLVRKFEEHVRGVSDIAWASNSRILCSASDDHSVKMWDIGHGDAARTLQGHASFVVCVSFNPQSNLVASGSFDETVRVWDAKSGRCLQSLPAHSDPVTAVEFNRDGSLIVSCSFDGLCRLWDTGTGQCLKTLIDKASCAVSFIRFSPNGRFLLVATLDSHVKLWAFRHRGPCICVKTFRGHTNCTFCVAYAFFSHFPSGAQWVVGASEDGMVYIWDIHSKVVLCTLLEHCASAAVLSVDVNPGSTAIASCSADAGGAVKMWSTSN